MVVGAGDYVLSSTVQTLTATLPNRLASDFAQYVKDTVQDPITQGRPTVGVFEPAAAAPIGRLANAFKVSAALCVSPALSVFQGVCVLLPQSTGNVFLVFLFSSLTPEMS